VSPARSPAQPPGLPHALLVASLGTLWLLALIHSAPTGFDLSKAGYVLYYPSSSGYFTQARQHTTAARVTHRSPSAWLADYEQTVAQGDVLHLGTHPPGLVLALQGLIALAERSPALVSLLRATEPAPVAEAFDTIRQLSARPAPPQPGQHRSLTMLPLSASDRAVLWLAMLLTVVAGGATVVPLWGLLRRVVPAEPALVLAAFWPAVPALALFLPKSDGVFPLLGCAALWAWNEALLASTLPRRSLLAGLAGLLLWLGLLCSLAFLPILAAGLLLTAWRGLVPRVTFRGSPPSRASVTPLPPSAATISPTTPPGALSTAGEPASPPSPGPSHLTPEEPRPGLVHSPSGTTALWPAGFVGLAVGLTLVGLTSLFGWMTQCDLPAVWHWNYLNHARFYHEYPRTIWLWLLVNPLEVLLAAGPPLVGLATLALGRNLSRRSLPAVAGSLVIVWLLLYLSGKNRGEAARLWLLMMPTLPLLAAGWLTPRPQPVPPSGIGEGHPGDLAGSPTLGVSVRPCPSHTPLLFLRALQLGYALSVVSFVVGFA